jgi:hypothetical protein
VTERFVRNESVTIGPRRWFGLLPGKVIVETTPVPIPLRLTVSEGRVASEAPEQSVMQNVQLNETELNTIVLALKFGRTRYGMLLQLAGQRRGTILSWEATGDLMDSLEEVRTLAAA